MTKQLWKKQKHKLVVIKKMPQVERLGGFLEITADRIVVLSAVSIIAFCGSRLRYRSRVPEQPIQYDWKNASFREFSKCAA